MKKFVRRYMFVAIILSIFHCATLGAPGILTVFAIADSSGKGSSNLAPGAVLITGPIDFITAPVQLPFLIPAIVKSIRAGFNSEFGKRASNDKETLIALLDESQHRELNKWEKTALFNGHSLIPSECFRLAFLVLKEDGSALAALMQREQIEEDHLRFIYEQEAELYRTGRKKNWSRVYRELSEHPKTPIDILKILSISRDPKNREVIKRRLGKTEK